MLVQHPNACRVHITVDEFETVSQREIVELLNLNLSQRPHKPCCLDPAVRFLKGHQSLHLLPVYFMLFFPNLLRSRYPVKMAPVTSASVTKYQGLPESRAGWIPVDTERGNNAVEAAGVAAECLLTTPPAEEDASEGCSPDCCVSRMALQI